MPGSPTTSVQEARAALAERLRALRLDAGITGKQLAAACGWSAAKSSRIAAGRTSPSDDDIRAWCRACGAEDLTADLIAARRQADSMYVEWRRLQRTGMRRLQEASRPLYERTRSFRVYASGVIPGYLQTPGYARALMGTIARFRGTPDDVDDAVKARIRRSQAVLHGNHRFATLIEENVLHHRVGDTEVMAGQLGHLLASMALPSMSIGIVPSAAAREQVMWPVEQFTAFDDDRVHVELLAAKVTVTAPGELEVYHRAFARLARLAVHGAHARALIVRAIDALA
ncbi:MULTISPECIES: helix-turn-helix domain-containing protein [Streptomyces]|uniref:XRE family transcriptional regulator n=1 Tax=Streptomyces tsukubensis (strain DSM 42081 / NBRC 108919 / NRRL 18488 / 9993) TaxID=1114943 RepID=I2MWB8_STRT9|nr:helix-turn-helix transcriptional regulator [Streptomyces tsukubensis]MYS67720.1 helix-turn-helix domain-containing protein [Streptomyces sp. SID5473]AZK93500.1 transcriptional regulator [Streptomyces tsukubensis]EIF89065.1 regulatory protein [Streptomyces tsukubensis NRRL18488]QKM70349.1 XRE family transcriptional regulator [Streptomyces tsukubensis NRRL18488]TAI45666.1 XRE family transcriptional regulator [Streptomyces tsukubensis]